MDLRDSVRQLNVDVSSLLTSSPVMSSMPTWTVVTDSQRGNKKIVPQALAHHAELQESSMLIQFGGTLCQPNVDVSARQGTNIELHARPRTLNIEWEHWMGYGQDQH